MKSQTEHIQTIVIGGGQAGLSTGYHLARRGLPFVILDAGERIGDAGSSAGTRSASSRPPASTDSPGCRFQGPAICSPRRIRWRTISSPTRRGSLYR